MLPPLTAKGKPHQRFRCSLTATEIESPAPGWSNLKWCFSPFQTDRVWTCMFGKIERSADPRFFFFVFCLGGGGGDTAQRHDVIFSCRQLAQESLAKSLFSPAHKGVFEPSPPRPSVSGSLPLPCPLKTSNVFFTQLCAGLCVQACVAFPLTRIQSQQHTHTHTHTHEHTPLPSTLRPVLTLQLLLLLLLLCCWLHLLTGHRYAAASHVRTLCFYHWRGGGWSESY